MSLCSAHRVPVPGCVLCASTPEDIFGKAEWAAALARAEKAGLVVCKGLHRHWSDHLDGVRRQDEVPTTCGFKFYLTVDACPLCGTAWSG